jgi:putative restriction endonuclease
MRYWWVNQNQTYKYEVPGGFLWSPKTRSDGARNPYYLTMEELRPGDLVFSFCDTFIKAIGIVQRQATTSPKPDFQAAGSNWSDVGWYVEIEFHELENPIRPKDFMSQIQPLLADKYAPLLPNGNGLQNIYLTEISLEFGKLLISLTSANLKAISHELAPTPETESEYEINLEIEARRIDGDLEKIQLTKSRRGQGIFKANVRLIENRCRITRVSSIKHLRASHIKPWAASSDLEKLDGNNGLLLSPHVDHLFDRGFISFKAQGDLLISPELNTDVLERWSISKNENVGNFSKNQEKYLEFHRDVIFQG